MNSELEKLCDSLDGLATAVKNTWGNDALMIEAIGWNAPALTRHDLAFLSSQLASNIRSADPEVSDEEILTKVQDFPRRLQLLQTHTYRKCLPATLHKLYQRMLAPSATSGKFSPLCSIGR